MYNPVQVRGQNGDFGTLLRSFGNNLREAINMNRFWFSLLLVSSCSLYSTALYAQQIDFEKREFKLHKVKRVTNVTYTYDSEGHESPITKKMISDYDKNGNLIKRTGSDSRTGQPLSEWSYKYDENNSIIESAVDGRTQGTASYKYDIGGHWVEGTSFEADGRVKEKTKYKYDQSGNRIESVTYGAAGEINSTYKFKYDSKGNMIENTHLSTAGSLVEKKVFVCNERGFPIQTLKYDSTDHVSGKTINTFTGDGQYLVEEVHYDAGGTLQTRTVYKLDAQGFTIEQIKNGADDKLVERTKSEYEFYQ